MERIANRVAILLDGRLRTVHPLDRAVPGALLRVRARTDSATAVAAVLAAISGITDVSQEEPSGDLAAWRVQAVDGDAADRVAASLCSAGIASVEPLERTSDLEALFLRLTASKAAH
jgi:ABC-2 type transport system ATP-binding protein